MRGVGHRTVGEGDCAFFNRRDFPANGDHRLTKAVDLGFALAFGRLDHQGAGHGKRHGRRVEAKIDQAFGDILDADAGGLFQRPQVDDALMGDQPVRPGVKDWVVVDQTAGDVIGVQDCHLGRQAQTLAAHHSHIHPRNRQDRGAAVGRRRDRADRGVGRVAEPAMARQERRQMGGHANGANARTAAAMGNAEGFVQIKVRDVAAETSRLAQADHGVQIGAVDINLAAMRVDDRANLGN